MKIVVFNQEQAEQCRPEMDHVIISITSPCRSANIGLVPFRKAILTLQFDDLDRLPSPEMVEKYNIKLITDEQAIKIADFVADWWNIPLLIVHCEAGISRSAGVAAAISNVKTGDDEIYFKKYLPNKLVYRKVLEKLTGLDCKDDASRKL